jgi:nitrogen-specific signal transduction histidine kinase
VAKGSYSLNIKEDVVDVSQFLRDTVADMQYFAHMEGVSVRVRKEDTHIAPQLVSDFPRIRQVVHNLISNAIKFSKDDIHVELLERRVSHAMLVFPYVFRLPTAFSLWDDLDLLWGTDILEDIHKYLCPSRASARGLGPFHPR